jgi:two-component system nitrogen regulation sensor histidine kinase NtrY
MRRADEHGVSRRLAQLLVVAAVGCGIATYLALTESPLLAGGADTLFWLLNTDLVLLLLLGAVVARQVVSLVLRRRRGAAGSRLHVRLVAIFAALAIVPAITVALFSALFFNYGVDAWFSQRVRTVVDESLAVAKAYLDEHQQAIRADALAMASDLNREAGKLLRNPQALEQFVRVVASARGLPEAMVFDGSGRVLARSALAFSLEFEPVTDDMLERAGHGEVVLVRSESDDRVRALVKLDSYIDTYLFVGRMVEPKVIAALERTETAVNAYKALEGRRADLQITLTLMFSLVAMLILFAAIWSGLVVAERLSRPLGRLIAAAERVRAGDFNVRVSVGDPSDEIGNLGRSFNRMTAQIETQRNELIAANRQLDLRRHFTEAVLTGVSAGVLGLDASGRIDLPNPSAADLLGVPMDELSGRLLVEVAPEMADALQKAASRPGRAALAQVDLKRDGHSRILHVRVVHEAEAGAGESAFVVTFDDITELMSAQRKAAWADVARRIAHEIKNPLTPIQLAAERLKRKYLVQISEKPEIFSQCIDTIVRQVDDMRRMVDEFSSFARMPVPQMVPRDLRAVCEGPLHLHSHARPEHVELTVEMPQSELPVLCDEQQISQALTNLLQNAVDAFESMPEGHAARICVTLGEAAGTAFVRVSDNGRGLPKDDRHLLVEPYVTTRTKGTGLGLAIVKKIMEDHGGQLTLDDAPGGGASVSLVLPLNPDRAARSRSVRHEKGKSANNVA